MFFFFCCCCFCFLFYHIFYEISFSLQKIKYMFSFSNATLKFILIFTAKRIFLMQFVGAKNKNNKTECKDVRWIEFVQLYILFIYRESMKFHTYALQHFKLVFFISKILRNFHLLDG